MLVCVSVSAAFVEYEVRTFVCSACDDVHGELASQGCVNLHYHTLCRTQGTQMMLCANWMASRDGCV